MRLRIDFSVRETDVPPEDARGIRFGDEIDAKQVFEFFNKCRDAVMTIFGQKVPKDRFEDDRKQLEAEIERLKREARQRDIDRLRPDPGRPNDLLPWEYRRDKHWMKLSDDGSRGGDGPPSPEFLKALADLENPGRDRY